LAFVAGGIRLVEYVMHARFCEQDVVGVYRVSAMVKVPDVVPRPGHAIVFGPIPELLAPVPPEGFPLAGRRYTVLEG
jgi:hypothetical protein